MKTMFGVSMTSIMLVLTVLFALCIATVLSVWLSNRVMFRMGLRNVARRRAQTGLVVLGLMLATLIITAAFTTGDSLDYSITKVTYDNLQRTDLSLHNFRVTGAGAAPTSVEQQSYMDERIVPGLAAAFRDDPDIEEFIPFLFEPVPVLNPRTKLSEPIVTLGGIDPQLVDRFGGLRLAAGGRAGLNALGDDQAFVNETLADKLDARAGDTITIYTQGAAHELWVAGIVRDERASGALDFGPGANQAGLVAPRSTVQRITGHPGQVNNISVVLHGDVRSSVKRSDAAAGRLEAYFAGDGKRALGVGDFSVKVEKNKQDVVEMAETAGSVFTTLFLVLGLFSIAAGIMLIFTIFVMLAAERKTEMGIARAVGAKRANLVQAFIAEGMVYDVLAGAVGAGLGVAAAFFLIVGGTRLAFGETMDIFVAHVTVRSLVVSYCLGVVLTFLTVVFSSLRISRLNIVAAVRGADEERGRPEPKRQTRWLWVALGAPALIVPPLGLYWLLRKGLGLPWAWVYGPTGIVAGVLLMVAGEASGQYFPFSLGVSLLPLAAALLARYYGVPNRTTWTAAGVALAVYWLTPQDWHTRIYGKLTGGTEMMVFSGIMIVLALTLVIVFNARLLNTMVEGIGETGTTYRVPLILGVATVVAVAIGLLLGGRIGGLGQLFYLLAGLLALATGLAFAAARYAWFAPALKMGVAYPLANRFRTGMTIAMFSLIIFSLTIMSVMNASFLQLFASDEARAGWDVSVSTNRNNPVDDLPAALTASDPVEGARLTGQITAIGRLTPAEWLGSQEVRQAGYEKWSKYWVRAGDDGFFAANEAKLQGRARGYASDRAVFEAMRTRPNLAVIDALPTQPPSAFGVQPTDWRLKNVTIRDGVLEPFEIEIRDPITGREGRVTVVGVLSSKIPANVLIGIFVNEQTYAGVYGRQEYRDMMLRLVPGIDSDRAAKGIKAALVTSGVQADSIQKRVEELTAQSRAFMRVFQAFMALGLFVGIAALGVIAFRSVVERRQQIGMLRAIGYQRGTVALSFILESSFIASMGILSGVVGAVVLSWNLITSNYIEGTGDVPFLMPWPEVILFIVIAFGFALLMTWWPSRRAAGVTIAEALRYE
jgi:putative ABC transport system permease protein